MKNSIYNKLFEYKGKYYIYNFFTGAFSFLENKQYFDLINNNKNNEFKNLLNDKDYEKFIKCGFLVSNEIDEIEHYLKLKEENIYNDKTLQFIIAPTLQCNFRCPYCYEKHINENMPIEVQNKIVEKLENCLCDDKFSQVLICWYGGEPLMCIDIIENLSSRIMKICTDKQKKLISTIVTNGYLLTSNNVKTLKKAGIKEVQVTIDGTKENHGKRRILAENKEINTYETIISGINKLTEQEIYVDIRMNIDKNNTENLFDAIDELNERILYKRLVRIYAGKIFNMPDTCGNITEVMQSKQYIEKSIDCSNYAKMLGFRTKSSDFVPKQRKWYCPAPYENSYVIAPNGDIYYCWNDIGQTKYRVDSLIEGIDELSLEEQKKWREIGRNFEKNCIKCQNLILCAGGCARNRVHGFHKSCEDKALYIVDILKKYIDNL